MFCQHRKYAVNGIVRFAGSSPQVIAQRLFMILRDLDREVNLILSEYPEEQGAGLAVSDRLTRAAGFRIIRAGRE